MNEVENRWMVSDRLDLKLLELMLASLREKGHIRIDLEKNSIPPTIAALLPEMEITRKV